MTEHFGEVVGIAACQSCSGILISLRDLIIPQFLWIDAWVYALCEFCALSLNLNDYHIVYVGIAPGVRRKVFECPHLIDGRTFQSIEKVGA